tara:strand:+ start:1524 stop:4103 length:2580 start_codon:yes stop_codon:yes gene_type:complete
MESYDYKDYFTHNISDTNGLIKFRDIDLTIGNHCNEMEYSKFYLQLTDKFSGRYLNLDIVGETQDSNTKVLATFYKKSDWANGLKELLETPEYIGKLKIYIQFTTKLSYTQWNMNIDIYIHKDLLLDLYELDTLPQLFCLIIKSDYENFYSKQYRYNTIQVQSRSILGNLSKTYKRNLFDYQRDNVNWMINQEYNSVNKPFITHRLPQYYCVYNINSINQTIIYDENNGTLVNYDKLPSIKLNIQGGVLCDDVGLGKTFSMLTLISEQLDKINVEEGFIKTTLLLCPTRLCKQWVEEIEKTYDLNYKLIGNIRQYKKLTFEMLSSYDLIILPYSFLINKNYLNLVQLNTMSDILLHNIKWNRVILDEGHEYINTINTKSVFNTRNELMKIDSKYKWICSATPYNNKYQCYEILNYICKFDTNEEKNYYDIFSGDLRYSIETLIDLSCRKNTRESVKEQVTIPEPIITTEFLNMSPIERTIYDSALNNNDKKIELCNHIMVSDEHISILGNKPLELSEVHSKMTEYYKNKINTYTKRLNNLISENDKKLTMKNKYTNNIEEYKNELIALTSKLEELVDEEDKNSVKETINIIKLHIKEKSDSIELIDNTIEENNIKKEEVNENLNTVNIKYKIFDSINDKIKENEDCPICLENLDELTRVITPCGHIFCANCINEIKNKTNKLKCAICRNPVKLDELSVVKSECSVEENNTNKLGTKLNHLINTLNEIIINKNNRVIVFSQWDNMLKLISKVLNDFNIKSLFINGSMHIVASKIRKFKIDESINVVLISSDKCPSGLNLTEANHIILLDSLNTTKENSKIIEEQAIGRAVRIGQKENVIVKRFIMRNTIEHDYYLRNIDN